MDNDRLINLLPEEYLPEPEFKAFPIFAAGLIILTVFYVFMAYKADENNATYLRGQLNDLTSANETRMKQAAGFTDVQANARFIASYAGVLPNVVLQAPDYWEIYNQIEELLPENTWVTGVRFQNVTDRWPDVVMECVSRGYSFSGPLDTYDAFIGNSERETRFYNLLMSGYQRQMVDGAPAVKFTIRMSVRYPSIEGE